MTGEQGIVRYGAMAFWAVVVVLLVARILLLDADKIRPGQGSALSPKPAINTSADLVRKIS